MKAHLMYRDRDFGWELESLATRPWAAEVRSELLPNEDALTQDLELNVLFGAMAGGDKFLSAVARKAVLSGLQEDPATILYRQAILKDCLRNESIVKNIYEITVEATSGEQRRYLSISSHDSAHGILYDTIRLLQMLMEVVGRLKLIADEQSGKFGSEGFATFFNMLKSELPDDYFAAVKAQLKELEFRAGVLMSAKLGRGNQGVDYVLRKSLRPKPNWIQRVFSWNSSSYTFSLDPRDEAGFQTLSELKDEGIKLVANAAARSADHVASFFVMLRAELAFYVGCLNLHRQLRQRNVPVCFPVPAPAGARRHFCTGLRDACL
ncbi:MAG: MutS-related protein, partial [Limisphaerales bacterium]